MNEIKDGLIELSKQEQARSMLKFGLFNSNHEAYAVLKEELDELGDAAANVYQLFELAWMNVKSDSLAPSDLDALRINLVHMGAELVQCIAMVNKWGLLYEDPRVDEESTD